MTIEKKFGNFQIRLTGAKIAVLVMSFIVFIAVMGVLFYWSRSNQSAHTSINAQNITPSVNAAERSASGATASYTDKLNQQNRQGAADADKTGTSFISAPVSDKKDAPMTPLDIPKSQEHPASKSDQQAPGPVMPVSITVPILSQEDRQVSGALDAEIDKITEILSTDQSVQTIFVSQPDRSGVAKNENVASAGASSSASPTVHLKADADKTPTTPKPGSILYGVFNLSITSDVPGPVLGEIIQGEYTGAKVLGTFQKGSGESDRLAVHVTTLVPVHGDAISVDGYVIDPHTRIDRHIASRTASFLGAAFLAGIQGYGQAVSQGGSTVVTSLIGNTISKPVATPEMARAAAVSSAMQQLQPVQQSMTTSVSQPNTIHIDAGTPFGLLIIK